MLGFWVFIPWKLPNAPSPKESFFCLSKSQGHSALNVIASFWDFGVRTEPKMPAKPPQARHPEPEALNPKP